MIAILADDLTSALDGAAPFASRGMSARVMLKIPNIMPDNVDVLSFDLDSRFLSSADAKARFLIAGECVRGAKLIYKTVDSTLRGNLGFETAGLMEGSGREHAIVVPAFTDAGRTTVLGHQYVNGIPLEQTEFACDPKTPVITGDVSRRMEGLEPHQFTVFDAINREDIDNVVAMTGIQTPVIWVGSPGIARSLATAIPAKTNGVGRVTEKVRKVMIVIGSLHSANQQQLDMLLLDGAAAIIMNEQTDKESVVRQVSHAFKYNKVVCLVSKRTPVDIHSARESPAVFIGQIVAGCSGCYDALVVTGGDTARRIFDALAANSVDLIGEAEPGVSCGILNLPEKSLPVVTKAGGFGNVGTLLHCARMLLSQEKDHHD